MDPEIIKRMALELMVPMVREFTQTVAEMREQGASEADITAMLDKVEADNRGKLEDTLLNEMMSVLRRAARSPHRVPTGTQ
jgi:hypothetical protein